MKSKIYLKGLLFYAYHGVNPQENQIGNEYSVDLHLQVDVWPAAESDCVEDTLNYADVYEAVKEEMNIPSKLIEHVAGRIVKRLFRQFECIEFIELNLSKRNPPMGADILSAGVELQVARDEMVDG